MTQLEAGLCAAAIGGHIRVGLEDNIRNIKGELTKGSWEQVEWEVSPFQENNFFLYKELDDY